MINNLLAIDAELKQRIYSIDFENIINLLVDIYHWPKKSALIVMQEYKNFLFLKKKYGNEYALPPSIEIDEFWHNHILHAHTHKYHQDCLFIFGEYLHHQPQHNDKWNMTRNELEKKQK